MRYQDGTFYMDALPYGADALRTAEEALSYINAHGFVPFFAGDSKGLSLEENTFAGDWWTEQEEIDPWEWRKQLASSGKVAYGHFFGGKAGFVSLDLFPLFCSYRRDGYDFDTLVEMGKVGPRERAVMSAVGKGEAHSAAIRKTAGFGKDGYKGFEGVTSRLQEQTYLVINRFGHRLNKQGRPYGWTVKHLATPEYAFGEDFVKSAYVLSREKCKAQLLEQLCQRNPEADPALLEKMLGR